MQIIPKTVLSHICTYKTIRLYLKTYKEVYFCTLELRHQLCDAICHKSTKYGYKAVVLTVPVQY